ncbi:pseudouridine synthase [Halioxenophilus sp. WMMB6]|uniref:pseudouridine synthase n=1 Tax=Halioxenophilus sp. WMMB6 TaxID=3073815 RepID=UPI00295E8714|nr:pseudouridine synthase [Halioxenophilus sp. WMMB6]
MSEILLFNKPYDVLSQFTDGQGRKTLGDYIDKPGFYPAGRLDLDSEGLLLLTDDGQLAHQLSHPRHKQPKTYWVQVEGSATEHECALLRAGVLLKDGKTLPAKIQLIDEPELWLRTNPVRSRQSIPTSWLEITISEGKNRQVRRMTAAVGLPTLRLVRVAIGPWQLQGMQPGDYRLETVHLPQTKPQTRKSNQSRRNPSRKKPKQP